MDAEGPVVPGRYAVAAAILAGGGGTRLGGVAKGLIQISGQSIIATQLQLMRPLFSRVFIVTSDVTSYGHLGAPLIADAMGLGLGPLCGIQAALSALLSHETAVVCVAADMPFLSTQIMCLLRDHAPTNQAVAPFVNGFAEPLCARYPREALATITQLVVDRRLKTHEALQALGAVRLPDEAWRTFDPEARFATNINTPEALAAAVQAAQV